MTTKQKQLLALVNEKPVRIQYHAGNGGQTAAQFIRTVRAINTADFGVLYYYSGNVINVWVHSQHPDIMKKKMESTQCPGPQNFLEWVGVDHHSIDTNFGPLI